MAITGFPEPQVAQTLVGNPAPPSFDFEADLLQRRFQILGALVLLHPRFAEVVEHIADSGDLCRVALDGLDRNALGIGGRIGGGRFENKSKRDRQ